MSRSFDRAVAPMTVATHLGEQVLVPRDAAKGFVVERARKERELYREVANLEHATAQAIAVFAGKVGALGRLPQITPSTAKALSRVVRSRARETVRRLAARSDLSPIELFVQALADSHTESLESVSAVPGADLHTKHSLVAAVLVEPLMRIVIEASEVTLRAIRVWDPVEGPAGLARRAAVVLRERARELAGTPDETRRAPAPVLSQLADALLTYADEMVPPSLATRDQLRALKDQVMRLPEPTTEGWGQPLAMTEDEEQRSFEGDAVGLIIRLTVELWSSFHDDSSDLWCLPTAPLWPMVWSIAPLVFSHLEELPAWRVCIHDRVEHWRTFAKESRAWVRAIDALRADEKRTTAESRAALAAAMQSLFAEVRPALGDSGQLADLVAKDTVSDHARLERLVELRCEAAGLLPLSRSRVLGAEGRTLWSIRSALCDQRVARRCAGLGCNNLLSVDAAPQRKKCIDCHRAQGRRRVRKYRAQHAPARIRPMGTRSDAGAKPANAVRSRGAAER